MNILLLGCGRWGRHYFRKLMNNENITSIAVVDPNPTGFQKIKDTFYARHIEVEHRKWLSVTRSKTVLSGTSDFPKGKNPYEDPNSVVQKDEYVPLRPDTPKADWYFDFSEVDLSPIDAAIIATPATTHFELANTLMECKIPVLIEKPVVLCEEELDALLQINADAFAAHQYRYHPAFQHILQRAHDGSLGKLIWAKTQRTHFGLVRDDVDMIGDLAPHDVDFLIQLFGERPHEICLYSNIYHAETWMQFGQRDPGIYPMATSHYSWASPYKSHQWEVYFENGCVYYNDYLVLPGKDGTIKIVDEPMVNLRKDRTIDTSPELAITFKKPDLLSCVLNEFLMCVQEDRESDIISLKSVGDCIRTLDEIYAIAEDHTLPE